MLKENVVTEATYCDDLTPLPTPYILTWLGTFSRQNSNIRYLSTLKSPRDAQRDAYFVEASSQHCSIRSLVLGRELNSLCLFKTKRAMKE